VVLTRWDLLSIFRCALRNAIAHALFGRGGSMGDGTRRLPSTSSFTRFAFAACTWSSRSSGYRLSRTDPAERQLRRGRRWGLDQSENSLALRPIVAIITQDLIQ